MILVEIKKIIFHALAHISLSVVWLFFVEGFLRLKRWMHALVSLEFLELKPDIHTFASIGFVLISVYVLHTNTQSLADLSHAQGFLFSPEAYALTPKELAAIYTLVAASAVLMAFFRGPLVFVGYFLAFVSYIVFVSM